MNLGGKRTEYDPVEHQRTDYRVSIGEAKKHFRKIDGSKATHIAYFRSFLTRDFADDFAEPLTDIINTVFQH